MPRLSPHQILWKWPHEPCSSPHSSSPPGISQAFCSAHTASPAVMVHGTSPPCPLPSKPVPRGKRPIPVPPPADRVTTSGLRAGGPQVFATPTQQEQPVLTLVCPQKQMPPDAEKRKDVFYTHLLLPFESQCLIFPLKYGGHCLSIHRTLHCCQHRSMHMPLRIQAQVN